MPLLAEYSLTPDVFDITCYANDELCGVHLQNLKEVLLQEGLVRDLRDGKWSHLFRNNARSWHLRGKELLKKLATQGRLVRRHSVLEQEPETDKLWCEEALASHQHVDMQGVIVTERIIEAFGQEPLVAAINKLPNTPWWTSRSPSIRLRRILPEYLNALSLVLRHANSLMFIDPHLDPSRGQYADFAALLQAAGHRSPLPQIEIHRVCYHSAGPSRVFPGEEAFEQAFRDKLTRPLQAVGLVAEVFIWDDFHARYLISNLIGILLENGFDTTSNPNAVTTWARLGRDTRDDVQREFDPASSHHSLKHRFTVP